MLLYYITDRTLFSGNEVTRRHLLLDKITEAAACGVDFIQLREKDLPTRELESLVGEVSWITRDNTPRNSTPTTRLLINSRTDVAISCAADGVHLRSGDISSRDARSLWSRSADSRAGALRQPLIGVSCHSAVEVERARAEGADFAVFGPVFEKKNAPTSENPRIPGLDLLRQACQHKIPVLALGGITLENARTCADAGAAGIAAIRLFQENKIAEVVRRLRD